MKRSPEPSQKTRIALVDELLGLEKEISANAAAFAAKEARALEIEGMILGWYDKSDASTSFVAEGVTGAYTVSARSLKTTVSYPAVMKAIGSVKFMAIATVTLDKLKKAAGEKYKLCVTSSRTGNRSLTQVGS